MSLEYVFAADGAPAVLDDMPPQVRALAVLLEHANRQRAAGLSTPCPCEECAHLSACFRAERTENPGEVAFVFVPTQSPAVP